MNGDTPQSARRVVIIGVGTPERGDDGAGRIVARRAAERATGGVEILELRGEAVELMDAWADAHAVVLVDAMPALGEVGRVHRFDASAQTLPAEMARASTHDMGVADAIELSRAMGSLPRRVIVYAIEGEAFGYGEGVRPEVERGIDEAAAAVIDEARALAKEARDA